MKKTLSSGAIFLMHILMQDETVQNKIYAAGEEGKTYTVYKIRKDGVVVLGETKYQFWNQLLQCQFKLPFESWALAVWDALLDLSVGGNQKALEEGLSTEIAKKAQRAEDYEWVVERLYDCYKHVCNNVPGGAPSEGGRDKHRSSVDQRTVICNGEPVVVNVNLDGMKRALRFPDATGKAFLKFDVGVVDVNVERDY